MLELIALSIKGIIVATAGLIIVSHGISEYNGAPFVPMRRSFVGRLLSFGEVNSTDTFLDIGSGDGRVLVTAVRQFQVQRAYGYEISPWPYVKSKFLIWLSRFKNIQVFRTDMAQADFSNITFVYCYLYPKLVDKIAALIAGRAPSGVRVLCADFPIALERHSSFRLLKAEKVGRITGYLYEKI